MFSITNIITNHAWNITIKAHKFYSFTGRFVKNYIGENVFYVRSLTYITLYAYLPRC